MRIVFSEDGRDFQRRSWAGVVDADDAATFFHTPAYLKLYWEEFGERPEHLLIAFGEEQDGRQIGACAFERTGTSLRFLGGTEVTDYMGPVAVPARRDEYAKELWSALLHRTDWETADLWGLPEDRPWLGLLEASAQDHGLTVERAPDHDGVAPFLALAPTWDAYLGSLTSKTRHEIKRKAKRLASEAGPFALVRADPGSLNGLLDRFVELHRLSEGPKGVFMQPGMEIFFRRLGEAFLPSGVFDLAFIDVGGSLEAGTIGFRFGSTFYLYNSAFSRRLEQLSPGMVLISEVIRSAIGSGCESFDLLKGDYAYKYRFGAVPRQVGRLVVSR